MGIDSIFLCVLLDLEYNDGTDGAPFPSITTAHACMRARHRRPSIARALGSTGGRNRARWYASPSMTRLGSRQRVLIDGCVSAHAWRVYTALKQR